MARPAPSVDGVPELQFENHCKLQTAYLGADMLFAIMDECWRILVPGGWMTVIVPCGRSSRAFQDPTHRRFFMQETFFYFGRPWREANGLSHYRVKCNFSGNVVGSQFVEETLRSADAQRLRHDFYWNTVLDWHAKIQKQP